MYMTVFEMTKDSIRSAENILNLNDGDAVHKWLTKQQHSRREEEKILYRVLEESDRLFLYVQSLHPFNTDGAELVGLVKFHSFDLENEFDSINVGDTIVFSSVVSPLHANMEKGGRKEFIRSEAGRTEWLNRKFTEGGLLPISSKEEKIGTLAFMRDHKEKLVHCVHVLGTAIVADKNQFREMVIQGVGKHKNFGAGLVLFK